MSGVGCGPTNKVIGTKLGSAGGGAGFQNEAVAGKEGGSQSPTGGAATGGGASTAGAASGGVAGTTGGAVGEKAPIAFEHRVDSASGGSSRSLEFGDLNGDASVFQGRGDATFAPRVEGISRRRLREV